MDQTPTHLDLFSGIGGFALAAQWAGFRTIGFCEIDPYCQKVLAKNFLAESKSARLEGRQQQQAQLESNCRSGESSFTASICSDIFDLDGTRFRGVDLITGGFPCQPFSVAGQRRGATDDRAIWPQMFRVIAQARPAWVLGENVPGIIPMELDNVLSDLEGIGYATRAFVIPACAVDARHRRDRVWIIGRRIVSGGDDTKWVCERQGESHRSRESETCGNQSAFSSHETGSAWKGKGFTTVKEHGLPNTGGTGLEGGAVTGNACGSGTQREEQSAGLCGTQDVADPTAQGLPQSGLESGESASDAGVGTEHCCRWLPEPDVGRVVDGLSLELDFARQINAHEYSHRSKKKSERNVIVWKLLRAVWEHRELAATSPGLYIQRLQDSVPEVPLRDTQSRWLLGSRIEANAELRDMWRDFYAAGLSSAQDLQFRLLERARTTKREQTLGNRVNRLKGLGNAIVPQVAYEILREIRKLI